MTMLCKYCAILDFDAACSKEGALHHQSYAALLASAKRGCSLCAMICEMKKTFDETSGASSETVSLDVGRWNERSAGLSRSKLLWHSRRVLRRVHWVLLRPLQGRKQRSALRTFKDESSNSDIETNSGRIRCFYVEPSSRLMWTDGIYEEMQDRAFIARMNVFTIDGEL